MNKWNKINENYLQFGLKIFPVEPNGKKPILNAWNIECSSEWQQVLYWYEKAKGCNWGLPCKENNLFVLDLDRHDSNKDGVENFDKLLNDLHFTDDEMDDFGWLEQYTPSNGVHIIFKSDDDLKNVPSTPNAFPSYPGIDIRNSSYIVIEPSEINGKKYSFNTVPSEPSKMPKKLKDYILKTVGTKEEKKKAPYEKPKEVFEGNRDTSLFEYLNQLYFKTRLDYDEILLLANHFNETVFDKPLPERTVKYKVDKLFVKDRGECLFLKIGGEENE